MPDGTSRFSIGKTKIHHYMGCSTFAQHTVLPEIARREGPRRTRRSTRFATSAAASRPASAPCIYTAKVEPGANVVVFGLGGIGLNVVQGARHGRAPT